MWISSFQMSFYHAMYCIQNRVLILSPSSAQSSVLYALSISQNNAVPLKRSYFFPNFLYKKHSCPFGPDMRWLLGRNSDLFSASVAEEMHAVSCYNGPCYDGPRLYIIYIFCIQQPLLSVCIVSVFVVRINDAVEYQSFMGPLPDI